MKKDKLIGAALIASVVLVPPVTALPVCAADISETSITEDVSAKEISTEEISEEVLSEETDLEENSEENKEADQDSQDITLTDEVIEDELSIYDEITKDDDTKDATIYNKGVHIGGVEKTDQTCQLTIEARGLEYLNEEFDKEIYALLTNVNNYSQYGIILTAKDGYKATMNVPAGHYILSDVGLTHGRAIDYFSIHKEVVCAPGTEEDFWFKLYSYKVELQKAEQQQLQEMQDYIEEKEPVEKAEYVTPVTGPGTDTTVKIEVPEKKSILSTVISFVSLLLGGAVVLHYLKKKEEKKKQEEAEDDF